MLKIRLQRTGNRNNAAYRLVVAEKSKPAKGKFIEVVGHYLPTRNPAEFEIQQDRVVYWLENGATPSDTAARLLTKKGISGLEKYMERYTKKRKKNAPPEEDTPPPPPPAAESQDSSEGEEESSQEEQVEESSENKE